METACVELKNIFDEYKKLKKYNKENNIRYYSDPTCSKIADWVKKYGPLVKSKDEIDDLHFRLFDNTESNEGCVVVYDLFNEEGCYVNIRKEFDL
jgi:hypothetical protein